MMEVLLKKLIERKSKGEALKYCIICDIDNVITDSREWFPYVPTDGSREGWDNYQSLIHKYCKPNKHMIDVVASIIDLIPVLFVTSRENRGTHITDTIKQLDKFSNGKFKIGENCHIYFREEFDYRHSDIVKKELLDEILDNTEYVPLIAIDDCMENCTMFKDAGITTLWYDIDKQSMETI